MSALKLGKLKPQTSAPEMSPAQSISDLYEWVESLPVDQQETAKQAIAASWNLASDLVAAWNEFGGDSV